MKVAAAGGAEFVLTSPNRFTARLLQVLADLHAIPNFAVHPSFHQEQPQLPLTSPIDIAIFSKLYQTHETVCADTVQRLARGMSSGAHILLQAPGKGDISVSETSIDTLLRFFRQSGFELVRAHEMRRQKKPFSPPELSRRFSIPVEEYLAFARGDSYAQQEKKMVVALLKRQ